MTLLRKHNAISSGRLARLTTLFAVLGSVTLSADTLVTKDGQRFEGELIGMEGGFISLSEGRSGGREVAIRRFSFDETDRIDFSDTDILAEARDFIANEQHETAIPALETLAFRRLHFFGKLQAGDEAVFASLLRAYCAVGSFDKCLERHKLWGRKLRSTDAIEESDLAAMTAAWRSGQPELAERLASNWIHSGRSSKRSAIAWSILASLAIEKRSFNDALWISLQPIAFADAQNPSYLKDCYEIAIQSATALGRTSHADFLMSEMRDRGYPIRRDLFAAAPNDPLPTSESFPRESSAKPKPNPKRLLGSP